MGSRIFFKIKRDGPGQAWLVKIHAEVAQTRGLPMDEANMRSLSDLRNQNIGMNSASDQASNRGAAANGMSKTAISICTMHVRLLHYADRSGA